MKANQGDKYAWTVKVGERGQIVIPKEARELFGIEPGNTLLLLGAIDEGLAIPNKEKTEQVMKIAFGGKGVD